MLVAVSADPTMSKYLESFACIAFATTIAILYNIDAQRQRETVNYIIE